MQYYSRGSEWRGWLRQLLSVNHSQAQFFTRMRAEDTLVLRWETSNMHKWEKGKKKTLLTATPVSFVLWSRANSGFAPVSTASTISHAPVQTWTIGPEIMYAEAPLLTPSVYRFLIKLWTQCGFHAAGERPARIGDMKLLVLSIQCGHRRFTQY